MEGRVGFFILGKILEEENIQAPGIGKHGKA